MSKEFKYELKIYYEDTDSGGVVYYANYLKFLERARTEMITSFKLSNKKLLNEHNTLIMVKSCNIDFINPAKLEDKIQIFSSYNSMKKASFLIDQKITNKDKLILEAKIRLVTVNPKGKLIKIPEVLTKALKKE